MNEPNDMLELPDVAEACPACGCEDESNFLGALGTALHYRCRDCGMMWMRKDDEEASWPIRAQRSRHQPGETK